MLKKTAIVCYPIFITTGIMVVERLILLLQNMATRIEHKSMIDYYEIGDGASIQDEGDCILAYVSAVPIMFPI